MLEALRGNKFEYTKLSPEECKDRGILGILYGPIADTTKPTRNGRLYPREAWEKALNDDLFQEQLHNKAILGELEHPDRETIDPREACVALADTPKIGTDGLLYGEFHILNLPNGKILKALCDYGTVVGVSSRGNGDLEEDINGNDSVVPDSFDLTTWDVVLTPAVKAARQAYVKESLGKKSLKESLNDLVKNSDDADKKIMEATIKNVEQKLNEGINTLKKSENINNAEENTLVANDNGTKEIVKSLTEALKDKSNLENEIKKLQEQLAVRDSEVNKLKEDLDKYKSSTSRLSTLAVKGNDLSKENSQLKEALEKQTEEIKTLKAKALKLIEMKKETSIKTNSLNESLTNKDNNIKSLQEKLDAQTKQSEKLKESFNKEKQQLTESLDKLNKEVAKQSKLAESYKKLANNIVESYIESKAVMLGKSKEEIKNKLPQKYTLKDIDNVCESLRNYSMRMNKLPFDLRESKYQIEVNTPRDNLMGTNKQNYDDPDDISGLANMLEK